MFRRRGSFTAVAGLMLAASAASAQTTWHVDDDACPGPGTGTVVDPFCSIQAGISASANGDTIIVAPGTYLETIDLLGKAVTVRSSDPDDPDTIVNTIIDGAGSFHVVQCVSGEGAGTVLSGLIITGGHANDTGLDDDGGGMLIVNSSPTITNCAFVANSALGHGGAIYCYNSQPTFTNCSFIGNIASGDGGAMFNVLSDPALTHCELQGNSADFGGAVYSFVSNPTITDCSFTGNHADGDGGGVAGFLADTTVTDCHFTGNLALLGGGARIDDGSTLAIAGTRFCGNRPDAVQGTWIDDGGNTIGFCSPPVPEPETCAADLNDDGVVNVLDLLQLLTDWGAC